MDMEREYRRYQNLLKISGMGIIAFGAWAMLKSSIQVFVRQDLLREMIRADSGDIPAWLVEWFVPIVWILVLILDIVFRLVVGLSARADSRGKKKSIVYIVLACICTLFYLLYVVYDLLQIIRMEEGFTRLLITTLVDATCSVVYLEMIYSATKLRKLRKKLVKEEV